MRGAVSVYSVLQNVTAVISAIPGTGEQRTLWIVIPLLIVSGLAVAAVMFITGKKKK